MSTVSPGCRRAFWNSARQAVTQGTPTAAPWPYDSLEGNGWTTAASTTASSAYRPEQPGVPSAATKTRSPGPILSTPAPTASTTPAPSNPGV
jgi:hypothetical protein